MVAITAAKFTQTSPLLPPTECSLQILRFIAAGDLQKAVSALSYIPCHDSTLYAALLHACAAQPLLSLGRALHRRLLLFSSAGSLDLFLSNHLINMYAKCGRTVIAHYLFDQMPRRNIVSWTALLTGYSHTGQHKHCLQLFSSMLGHCIPNEYGIVAALSSSTGAWQCLHGRQVHALACKISLDSNVFVGNSLITVYSSCDGFEEDSWLVFKTMPFRNIITWNSMIAGFQHIGKQLLSLELFCRDEALRCGI
ncbi:hypothetical protein HPP92_023959 [Vanilla planifolia]|uniref:Pentatricopeptide repeat-containing protein n=1 Tax=Vanilla planifolia TaxID=51239 RepID=A0A835PLI7_VANPL|nr:hypothetical protein HPP92_023959 [Vanilla planifolia]